MNSSTYIIPISVKATPITADTNILNNDAIFTNNEFNPGKAGLIRIWLTVATAGDADTIISISSKAAFADPEQLNADQNFVIKSKGKYRFDIDVESGDIINIRSSIQITKVLKLRFHKIIIGA